MPKALSDIVGEGVGGGASAFAGGGGGGGLTAVDVALDFGATPVPAKRFTVTTPVAVGRPVLMQVSASEGDTLELDHFVCAARVSAADTIDAFVSAVSGPVAGVYTFTIFLG